MPAALIHEVFPVGLLQCNCSILGDPETREAIVIDPGDETDRIQEILARHQLRVRAILSTHTHIDHVGGLALLHRATMAPVLIHEADLDLYQHLDIQSRFLGVPSPETMRIQDFLKEGDAVRCGGFVARVLHTPGHTPGSISLLFEGSGASEKQAAQPSPRAQDHGGIVAAPEAPPRLLAGDTLFQGSIGRTDLWGGSYTQIIQSIRDKILPLPDDVVVYPGHGDLTTIGAEREENPFLR